MLVEGVGSHPGCQEAGHAQSPLHTSPRKLLASCELCNGLTDGVTHCTDDGSRRGEGSDLRASERASLWDARLRPPWNWKCARSHAHQQFAQMGL